MTWTAGSNTVGYVVYRQDTGFGDITWAPTEGTDYTTSSNISADSGYNVSSKIIYVGSDTSFNDNLALDDNKTYMYKIFSYNSKPAKEYSSGVQRLSRTYPDRMMSSTSGSAVQLGLDVCCQ